MAQISAFALCLEIVDHVSADGILEPELRNSQPALRPAFVSTEYSFGIYVGLLGIGPDKKTETEDQSRSSEVEFVLDDAMGNAVARIGPVSILSASSNGSNVPAEHDYVAFELRMQNVKLESEGIYHFRTILNGQELDEQLVPVCRLEATA